MVAWNHFLLVFGEWRKRRGGWDKRVTFSRYNAKHESRLCTYFCVPRRAQFFNKCASYAHVSCLALKLPTKNRFGDTGARSTKQDRVSEAPAQRFAIHNRSLHD